MSKTNEYKLFQLLKNNLKNTHFTRIESHTELGIPDVMLVIMDKKYG